MNQSEAMILLEEHVRPVFELLMVRNGASLQQVVESFLAFEIFLGSLPDEIGWPENFQYNLTYQSVRRQVNYQWPELGLYASESDSDDLEASETIGDALDDFTDIAFDLGRVLEMSSHRPVEALSQLRFWHVDHFDDHIHEVIRRLKRSITYSN